MTIVPIEPIDPIDPIDPIHPIDRMDRIDRIDPLDRYHRNIKTLKFMIGYKLEIFFRVASLSSVSLYWNTTAKNPLWQKPFGEQMCQFLRLGGVTLQFPAIPGFSYYNSSHLAFMMIPSGIPEQAASSEPLAASSGRSQCLAVLSTNGLDCVHA